MTNSPATNDTHSGGHPYFVGMSALWGTFIGDSLAEVVRQYRPDNVSGVLFYQFTDGVGEVVHPETIKATLECIELEDSVGGGI